MEILLIYRILKLNIYYNKTHVTHLGSDFDMKILIYSSQILKLCFGIFQLRIKPDVFIHAELLIWLLAKSILFVLGLQQLVLFLNCCMPIL